MRRRQWFASAAAATLGAVSTAAHAAEKKHVTQVIVYKNGRLSSGRRVVLEFTGFLGGMTDSAYTDSDGVAMVPHASTGEVKVFVDGDFSSHRTTGKAPGKIVVYLK